MIEEPDRAVRPLEPGAAHRVAIRRPRPGEGDDVHRQNAEQGKPAQDIDRGQPLESRNRLRAIGRQFRWFAAGFLVRLLRIEHRRLEIRFFLHGFAGLHVQ